MKKHLLSLIVCNLFILASFAQIGIGTTTADASSMLEVKSTTKGMLVPRMTSTERTSIATPAIGLLVFDNTTQSFWYYKSTGWMELIAGGGTGYWTANGTNIYNNNTGNVGIGTSAPFSKLSVVTLTNNHGITHTDGTITVGTYVGLGEGWYGTKSNHPLSFFTNNSPEQVTLLTTGNLGIGTTTPDYRLNVASNIVQSNTNTNLLKLVGQNPLLAFSNGTTDFGYIKAWSYQPYAPFTNGLVIGTGPGYPIFFSTNNYSLSMIVADNGNVGIGTANPTYKLSVNGNIRSKEVVVETGWADYVFNKSYKLKPLAEVETFIENNNHLEGIPSAQEIEKTGLHVGDTQKKMMEKIEELTLYVIELNKQIKELQNKSSK